MTDPSYAIPVIIFFAVLMRCTFGFGDAVFAVPLFGLLSDISVGNPALAAVGTTITAIMCFEDRRQIEWRQMGYLLAPTILGIPLGIWILTNVDTKIALILVGFIVTTFSAYSLISRRVHYDIPDWVALPTGFIAGVLGGAFNFFGLPIAIYGGLKRWPPEKFRLLAMSFFLPTGLIVVIGHGYAGLWGSAFRWCYLVSIIPALGAMVIGRKINRSIDPTVFRWLVWWILIALGLMLMYRNL